MFFVQIFFLLMHIFLANFYKKQSILIVVIFLGINSKKMIKYVNNATEWDMLHKSGKTLVCDFFAEWCGPCRRISSSFLDLSKKFQDNTNIEFLKINIDDNPTLAAKCGIKRLPTFQIWKSNIIIETFIGANIEYFSRIENYLQNNLETSKEITKSPQFLEINYNFDEEWKELMNTTHLVVTFFAPSISQQIYHEFLLLSQDFSDKKDLIFLVIDVTENPNLANQCEVTRWPTLQVWKNKHKIKTLIGGGKGNIERLKTFIIVQTLYY